MDVQVNTKFNKLTVIRTYRKPPDGMWAELLCECGKTLDRKLSDVIAGRKKSCGCLRADNMRKQAVKGGHAAAKVVRRDLAGQRFGKLTVLSEAGRNKAGSITWRCQCDCGNETVTSSYYLRRGDTTSCGCHKRQRISETWKDIHRRHRASKGLDPNVPMLSQTAQDRALSQKLHREVKRRDKFTCMLCGVRGGRLVSHHIYPWSEYPAFRYVAENLATLCRDCHVPKAHAGNQNTIDPEIQASLAALTGFDASRSLHLRG